jgi:two-component system cell cycle sensor histidine kinase/response regulator CckA
MILVVDDEAAIRTVTRGTLSAYGYRVLSAENGAEAIAQFALHREEVAAVITDTMMPIMDGAMLISALQQIGAAVPIVVTSGLKSELRTKHTFLAKPFSAAALLTCLHTVLNGSQGRR